MHSACALPNVLLAALARTTVICFALRKRCGLTSFLQFSQAVYSSHASIKVFPSRAFVLHSSLSATCERYDHRGFPQCQLSLRSLPKVKVVRMLAWTALQKADLVASLLQHHNVGSSPGPSTSADQRSTVPPTSASSASVSPPTASVPLRRAVTSSGASILMLCLTQHPAILLRLQIGEHGIVLFADQGTSSPRLGDHLKKRLLGRRPVIAFLELFLFRSLLHLTPFLSEYQTKTRNWWETFRPLRGFFSLRFEVQVWGLDYYRKRIGLIGVWEKTEGAKVSQVNMYWRCKKVKG